MRYAIGCALVLAAAGCGGGGASVSIVFPNEVARDSVRRLRVEAYDPEAGGGPSERDCNDFLGKAQLGMDPLGAPVRADYQCVETAQNKCEGGWFNGREDLKIPRGRRIIYVLAFASTDEGATPILEGCTDRFDSDGGGDESDDVPINLELVIPENARMIKSAGDRQVGRAGEELSVPLEVRVQADSPDGTGGTYDIPGVPIRFTSEDPSFAMVSGNDPMRYETFTDGDGRASVRVRLPNAASNGEIVAFASALVDEMNNDRAELVFSVSVTEPVAFATKDVLSTGDGALPVAIAVGNLDGNGDLDLAIATCQGARDNCTPGVDAVAPFGATRVTVYTDVGDVGARAQLMGPPDLGVLPADLLIDDVAPPQGRGEVVLANSRRADCVDRVCTMGRACPCYGAEIGDPCPCEGSELAILAVAGGNVTLRSRHTMTGSNAVALATFESQDTGDFRGVAMVAQGRSVNTRPCSRANRCLPYLGDMCDTTPELCGCPPAERCECPGCGNTSDPGVCVARDKMVDLLVNRTVNQVQQLYNKDGCQVPVLSCNNQDGMQSTCTCIDDELGNNCTGADGCNCKVPERIYVGDIDAPVLPYAIAAGPLQNQQSWDIVVPSVGGLELFESRPSTFQWKTEPIINAPVHDALVVDLDLASESRTMANPPPDVVWIAREPCLAGDNFNQSCRIWRELDDGVEPKGCLGAYFTDGETSIFTLRTPTAGGCRRHYLEFEPHGLCAGEFNDDGHVDIAVASRDVGYVAIFSGDGFGGLLDPPVREDLPGGRGGPIACGDLDGDGRDDIAVANGDTGAIYLLRTGN